MRKVILLLMFAFAAVSVSAQDNNERGVSAEAGRKATFERNGFWDNWFVGAGAGVNAYFGDNSSDVDFTSRMTLAPTVQFGKWYNPYLGGRLKFTGGSLHTFGGLGSTEMIHQKYVGGEVDFMFNFTNYICKYNEKRLYSFIPYVGLGAAYSWDNVLHGNDLPGHQSTLTLNAGIINNFRLSNRLSLAVDLSGAFLRDAFDRTSGGDWGYDGLANASASFVYKIGKSDFKEAVLLDQNLLDDLNSEINRLKRENERLANRKIETPPAKECPKCPQVSKAAFVSNVVFFRIGSANVDAKQEISIYNTAKYLQDNPNAKVRIVGYADKATGTASINDRLSEKRAKNVANALINKYNIDSNRVTVEWKGDTVQPYAQNDWNRVAIFFAE